MLHAVRQSLGGFIPAIPYNFLYFLAGHIDMRDSLEKLLITLPSPSLKRGAFHDRVFVHGCGDGGSRLGAWRTAMQRALLAGVHRQWQLETRVNVQAGFSVV